MKEELDIDWGYAKALLSGASKNTSRDLFEM